LSGSESKPENSEFNCIWECGICVSVCAENAISHGSDLFVIDKAACSNCLVCVRTCPAGVIQGDLFA
jgi:Fe-S-cluster-containing hydrogenase component 2